MNRAIAGIAVALSLVLTQGAWGHEGEIHDGKGHHEHAGVSHAAALGIPGDASKVSRTIEIEMSDDMRFSPAVIRVKRGETIRFVVRNVGKMKHELVLGTKKELKEHAVLMSKHPGMKHADPNQVSADPGKRGELLWKFTRTGDFDFACLEAGHTEAGMVGRIHVSR